MEDYTHRKKMKRSYRYKCNTYRCVLSWETFTIFIFLCYIKPLMESHLCMCVYVWLTNYLLLVESSSPFSVLFLDLRVECDALIFLQGHLPLPVALYSLGFIPAVSSPSPLCRSLTDGKKWAALGSGVGFYSFLGLNCLPGLSCGSDDKESACNAGDLGLIPGSGRSPGGGNGSPLQYCYLENSTDRGTWQATVHGVAKSLTWLSDSQLSISHCLPRWYDIVSGL